MSTSLDCARINVDTICTQTAPFPGRQAGQFMCHVRGCPGCNVYLTYVQPEEGYVTAAVSLGRSATLTSAPINVELSFGCVTSPFPGRPVGMSRTSAAVSVATLV